MPKREDCRGVCGGCCLCNGLLVCLGSFSFVWALFFRFAGVLQSSDWRYIGEGVCITGDGSPPSFFERKVLSNELHWCRAYCEHASWCQGVVVNTATLPAACLLFVAQGFTAPCVEYGCLGNLTWGAFVSWSNGPIMGSAMPEKDWPTPPHSSLWQGAYACHAYRAEALGWGEALALGFNSLVLTVIACLCLVGCCIAGHKALRSRRAHRVEPSEDEVEVPFYFLRRDVVLEMPSGTAMPRFQTLMQAGHLEKKSINVLNAFRGAYRGSFLIVSHRWMSTANPDPEGQQMDEVRKHVSEHPEIEWVWIDYPCMPQVLKSDDGSVAKERTVAEQQYFNKAIKHINILYLTLHVLILLDRNYNSRFWCLLEAILALHVCDENGLAHLPADPARQHHTIICMFAAQGTNAATSLEDEFGGLDYVEALDKLLQPDIYVTNKGDKAQQIERLQKLVDLVRGHWQHM